MSSTQLDPVFVETIPEKIEEGVLYVSMSLASAMHLCACGCRQEVVTPLSPTDWQLYFDGENISLEPSIGNWSFLCRSHYWIEGGRIRWSGSMSKADIEGGRARDSLQKMHLYSHKNSSLGVVAEVVASDSRKSSSKPTRLHKLKLLLSWLRKR